VQTFPAYAVLLFEGFAENPAPLVSRTEMESGPPKQAKSASRGMSERPVLYALENPAQLQSFKEWFKSIGSGADWFLWNDPVDGVQKPARIVGGQIAYKPRVSTLQSWRASFTLETWE